MSKLDHSTLATIQALSIKINHFIHIDIEDSFWISPAMDAFLKSGVKTVSATLNKDASSVKKYNDSLDNSEKHDIQRDLMWTMNGIIINVETPVRFPSKEQEGWCTSNQNNTVNFWFHGDTYEEALLKAQSHIEEFHRQTINLELFPNSKSLFEKIKSLIKL